MHTISLMLHVLFAALLVGPQVLLALAVVPSTWLIEDEALRRSVTRVVTQRYARIASVAIVGLLVTGLYQYVSMVPSAIRADLAHYRFGYLFMTKMVMFVLVLALIAVHAGGVARRITRISEAVERGEATPDELEAARRTSFMLSMVMMLLSIAALMLGAALGNHESSYIAR